MAYSSRFESNYTVLIILPLWNVNLYEKAFVSYLGLC